MAHRFILSAAPLIAAAFASQADAQTTVAALDTVTITGHSPTSNASVGGFGDVALSRSPLQATVVTLDQLSETGGTGLTALTRFDASISDAYNSTGYWTNFTVRGFVLDPQSNYRRDGLPINAETTFGLENKSSVEVLKGTNGIQAGMAAPGGLVNLIVKRPDADFRSATLGWRENGTYGASADISQRFGAQREFGLRLNVAAEHLDPPLRDAEGNRRLIALAGDWKLNAGSLLEAEVETSHQSQRSQPGFSLLGDRLPDARDVDPRINLNNQPWSLPVVMDGTTASLRWTQQLSADWKLVAHGGIQRLTSDDRLAYSFGCSKDNNYSSYCADGSFDYYDYRSDGEHRNTDAFDLHAEGDWQTGPLTHHLAIGALTSRFTLRTQPKPDDGTVVGSGTVDGLTMTQLPTDPPLADVANTNQTDRSTELYLRDRIELTTDWSLWAGLRHTRLNRQSIKTDGSNGTDYSQSFDTPWLALSYAVSPELLAYASWGEGVESEVTPNRAMYVNAGAPLPSLKSRQVEVGLKRKGDELDWSLTAFDIRRPQFGDACNADGDACTHQLDGNVRHRGIEAEAEWKRGNYALQGSAMWLDAKRHGSTIDPTLDGKRPTNVPAATLKLTSRYFVPALSGLDLNAGIVYESSRMVLPDNSVSVPSWTRLDLAARYVQRARTTTLTWLVGVDNATDRRAWVETPYQYDHAYLFPMAPRTWRLSLRADI